MPSQLFDRIRSYEYISRLVQQAIVVWPEHAPFLVKSLISHSDSDCALLERLSRNIVLLAGDSLSEYLKSYRWMCEVFNDEQIYFVRNKKYRYASFAEVNDRVYSNKVFMQKYMEGLLVSQLFWQNHAKSYIFHSNFVRELPSGFRYLEIGPGHGLYLATVASEEGCISAEAWDISAESLAQTESSIRRMGVTKPVRLMQRDVQAIPKDQVLEKYDVIVISEVLEHLEQPDLVLRNLKLLLSPKGKILINFPINSPAPDHIFLLESLEAVQNLVEEVGLNIEVATCFPATGYTLERAMSVQATVSCAIIAGA